jgi:hypothetical protein
VNYKQFKHVEHPDIPEIRRITVDGKRRYETPTGVYTSITTLLHSLPPSPGLMEWKERVGEAIANYAMNSGARRGTKLHRVIESYLSNNLTHDLKQEYGVVAGKIQSLCEAWFPSLHQSSSHNWQWPPQLFPSIPLVPEKAVNCAEVLLLMCKHLLVFRNAFSHQQ